jgi:hypothetical protein
MSSHTYVVDFDEPYIRNIPTEFRPITNPNLALVASAGRVGGRKLAGVLKSAAKKL